MKYLIDDIIMGMFVAALMVGFWLMFGTVQPELLQVMSVLLMVVLAGLAIGALFGLVLRALRFLFRFVKGGQA